MSSDTVLSIASVDDLDVTCELLRAQFAEHSITLGEARFRAGVEGLLRERARGMVILATEAGRPVGIALSVHTWTVEQCGEIAWLEELYVVPERRELGIGGKLLARAVEAARERGCLTIDLEVEAGHARAAHLYQRAAFRRLDRTHWTLALRES